MFSNVFAALVPALIFCAFVFIPVVIISWIRKFQTKKKRNPLNLEMLRNPGQSSLDEIEKTSDGIMECLFIFATTPVYIYALAITQYVANQKNINLTTLIIYTSTLIGILIYFSVKLYKLFAIRNKYRLGYDCELMAGQELAILIKTGFNIFHDFPAANFNIDHIAVGPTGIFAIETKG